MIFPSLREAGGLALAAAAILIIFALGFLPAFAFSWVAGLLGSVVVAYLIVRYGDDGIDGATVSLFLFVTLTAGFLVGVISRAVLS